MPQLERRSTGTAPYQTRTIYSMRAGDSRAFRVYQRDDLRPGDTIDGPAAIEEPGTTTIIDAADNLSVEDHGCLIIQVNASSDGGSGASIAPLTHTLDPITVQVVRAALNAAAERMRITMIKTAYNHIISESLDFGCAIFDPDVQMIAQGIGLPVFQGHLGFPIEATIQDRGIEAFREGDIFIHNDPYAGNGNHLNDVAMTAPVFWEGQLTGFVSVKAHWSDVGGPVPSSMQVGSREFRQEGLRFQSVRLFSRGEINDEVMRMIRGNIRTESGTLKDVQAMIAVCRTGEASFHEILAKYGRETVLDATRIYMEQSERRTRAALAAIPAGTYRADGTFDNDGITLDQPVRVAMAITVGDGAMTVDFTGSDAAGGRTVQLRRRHHDQRLPAADQVPDHAARPRSTRAASGRCAWSFPSARCWPPRSRRRRRATTCRSTYSSSWGCARWRRPCPTGCRPAPTATRCRPSPSARIPQTGRLFIQGDLNAGGTGARPARSMASRR